MTRDQQMETLSGGLSFGNIEQQQQEQQQQLKPKLQHLEQELQQQHQQLKKQLHKLQHLQHKHYQQQQQLKMELKKVAVLLTATPKAAGPTTITTKPFKIALIDIKMAAEKNIIHCVEEPLVGNKKFVALSYRWGELSEATVDTGIGYLATVTSFALDDFFELCKMMAHEVDLKDIKYVWVDAICVDQNNYERRKETIHQMSNIYLRADYILAVPDLHLEYLKKVTATNRENIENASYFHKYIVELIHGNEAKDQHIQFGDPLFDQDKLKQDWKERKSTVEQKIRNSIEFLVDLIKDWASRVWVISEYNIARKKNKMKYWFIQLRPDLNEYVTFGCLFFEFDFDPSSFSRIESRETLILGSKTFDKRMELLLFGPYHFHKTMIWQLNEQTFLERILKSKASRNEDRFNAVMPLSKYKNVVGSKEVVASWKIHTLTSVKLRLYEFMDIKDKLTLLYLSGTYGSLGNADTLPTFASSNIDWLFGDSIFDVNDGGNFDLTNKYTIMLVPISNKNDDDDGDGGSSWQYKLNLKPMDYLVYGGSEYKDIIAEFTLNETLCKRLELDDSNMHLDIVCIPNLNKVTMQHGHGFRSDEVGYIALVGSFETNKWILRKHDFPIISQFRLGYRYFHSDDAGFDIY